jgi:phage-related protein
VANKTAVLSVRVVTDAKQGTKGMDDMATGVQKFEQKLDRLAVPAGVALAAIGGLAKGAIDSASALQQSTGGVESVFAEHAAQVKAYAADAATNVGLATSQYQDLATVIGSQLKNMGVPMEAVAGQTNDLVTLGADLAATFGGTTADAVSALSSLLRGERDPIERYGVSINEAAVQAQMAEMGLSGLSGEAEKNAKLQATLALLTKQTADAQGQFAREADTAAGAQQIAAAEAENARAKIGEGLLPVYTELQTILGQVATFLGENATAVTGVVTAVGALAAGVLVVNGALKAYAAVQAIVRGATVLWTGAQWALNAAMNANPIGLIIAAIAAVVAIVIYLWNNCEGFRDAVLAIWEAIKTAAEVAWNWIKDTVTGVIDTVKGHIELFKAAAELVWARIKAAAAAVWNWIKTNVIRIVIEIQKKIELFKLAVELVWNAIKSAASTAWNWIKSTISSIVAGIQTTIQTWGNRINTVWNGIKTAASTVWTSIKTAGQNALNVILTPINAVKNAFQAVWNMVQNVINTIRNIRFPEPPGWMRNIGSGLSGIFSRSAAVADEPVLMRAFAAEPEPEQLVAPARFAAASGGGFGAIGAGGGDVYNITVNGALDPLAVGRQIEALVGRSLRRTGRRTLGQAVFG